MTDDQKKLLAEFETKVRKLMFTCQTLQTENKELMRQLLEKEEEIQIAKNEISSLNTKYENLKIARIISVKQDDINGAKQRLSKLVREVDKCIALLNE